MIGLGIEGSDDEALDAGQDEEVSRWEQEQIRKGISIPQVNLMKQSLCDHGLVKFEYPLIILPISGSNGPTRGQYSVLPEWLREPALQCFLHHALHIQCRDSTACQTSGPNRQWNGSLCDAKCWPYPCIH